MINNTRINGLFFHDDIIIKQKEDVMPLIRYAGDIAVRLMSNFEFSLNEDPNVSNLFVVKIEPMHVNPGTTNPLDHIRKIIDAIENNGYNNQKDTLILMLVSEGDSSWNQQMNTYVNAIRPNYSKENIYFANEQLNSQKESPDLLKKISFFNISVEVSKESLEIWNLIHDIPKDKLFLSFNRRPNYHRTQLVLRLINDNLIEHGIVSFYNQIDDSNVNDIIDSMVNKTEEEKSLYKTQLKNNLILDNIQNGCLDLTSDLIQNYYKRTYFSIVTETRAKKSELSFTEKTFKPIGNKHPFIILGVPGLIKWLRKMGFKTFHPMINESYDEIDDYELRFNSIMSEVNRLSNLSQIELEDFWNKTKEITEYNFNYFNSDEFFNRVDYCTELFPFIEKFKSELEN